MMSLVLNMADAWGTAIVKNRSNLRINISPSVNNYGDALGVNQERDAISQKNKTIRLQQNETFGSIMRIGPMKTKLSLGSRWRKARQQKGKRARERKRGNGQEVSEIPPSRKSQNYHITLLE
jgi:hypothetical protein